jgi:hypothetical protein
MRTVLALVLVLAGPAMWAVDELLEAEQRVTEALRAHDLLRTQREVAGADAARLAQEIAALKARTSAARADPALEQRLRAFDRQAARLDDLDRQVRQAARQVERARSGFRALSEDRSQKLARQGAAASADMLALEAARRRVLAQVVETGARSPLDIAALESDTPGELQAKQALLQSEQARLADEPERMARAETVLAARLEWKRRLVTEVRSARRAAGSEWRLLESEADALQADVRDLEREELELRGRMHLVREWQQGLEQRLTALRARLDLLTAARPR